jgi:hypothetical protein
MSETIKEINDRYKNTPKSKAVVYKIDKVPDNVEITQVWNEIEQTFNFKLR